MTTLKKNSPQEQQAKFMDIRMYTVQLCAPLEIEDYVVQPIDDVSPPKWHLGHTTWFFETFILAASSPSYQLFDPQYNFVFNSYYETLGARVIRTDRGNLSRPSVADIYRYREYVDGKMLALMGIGDLSQDILDMIELGLNHEQQHQELLLTDIKYILGHNPLFPSYSDEAISVKGNNGPPSMISIKEGIYELGFNETGFCFDNELGRNRIYLNHYEISNRLVTNREYLQFMTSGGYTDFQYWHSEGWDWVKKTGARAPLYWHLIDGRWMNYGWSGIREVDLDGPVCHINFFEASAYSSWKGMRIPTEAEWEIASENLQWGECWEWTASAYLPYPGFKKQTGAVGEYNGKFMVNQMVLRGASVATPKGHSRNTYRNFFHSDKRWQFTGIRLAR